MGYKPFSLGPWSSTTPVKLSFTKKFEPVSANQQLLSMQNLLMERRLVDAMGQCSISLRRN
jgi:hypothetical protein